MTYILDTSAILEILAGTQKGEKIRGIVRDSHIATTSITFHEIMIGERSNALQKTREFLNTMEVIPFDKNSALESFLIEIELASKGRMVNKMDMLIAGICRNLDFPLVTLDNDFKNISSLDLKLVA